MHGRTDQFATHFCLKRKIEVLTVEQKIEHNFNGLDSDKICLMIQSVMNLMIVLVSNISFPAKHLHFIGGIEETFTLFLFQLKFSILLKEEKEKIEKEGDIIHIYIYIYSCVLDPLK